MTSTGIISESAIIDHPVAPTPAKVLKSKMLLIVLQISHRLGAISLICTLATWAMMYQQKSYNTLLAATAGTAEAGLAFGLTGRFLTRQNSLDRREVNGVCVFNLLFFLLAVYLMLFTRLDVIRSAAGQFFSPSAPAAPENHW